MASAEYQTLKAQFSLLYHECAQLKQQADESRSLLQQTRTVQARQIEEMEVSYSLKLPSVNLVSELGKKLLFPFTLG